MTKLKVADGMIYQVQLDTPEKAAAKKATIERMVADARRACGLDTLDFAPPSRR